MKLFLLRHGAAAAAGYSEDRERPLTDTGREQLGRLAGDLAENNISFDVIVTSPFVRAYQTAEIIADRLKERDKVFVEDLLAPGCELGDLMEILERNRQFERILCVGHEPDLGEIAGQLLFLDTPRPLKKGELIEIELN
ncbi:phosphohistidine phosphatase SixA [candidate division WOR-1 bacterium RIFOXYA12_FULL_52_29]|uniref:Phosphohistidine phosphatase SixA n=1 Tax=candidate division WOR-1 bacterium RIFOXYC12_FULL_54_18 TaxID=1802584 RepID=A0A1F4T4J9_UNCSA|nr:MAG: phosphohistidine phosphatase SixA [candidate division WOR-1 bacterium RIFOXYA2_FULL_51_19]OGC17211.1 MAG: phosphohistidine phosphatase SixA [candidate division WOR-1 bacterium RIFOXYA12_FULL_52_29]OGC26071.1 MAG: phosphohistidine phosphatase SixA [candidate division WOR-1 bacterium RIFOXYB2_FULL_45_9]OGC27628.1 MAG: phosphohistidine phosphatase SixA [candidate division WOR-1 bacterium RIFOXYC12_FULL_54_18]OGC29158.1 MAG: phosphohistidine phosphatase SixA [candidate division WOR-1 bacter